MESSIGVVSGYHNKNRYLVKMLDDRLLRKQFIRSDSPIIDWINVIHTILLHYHEPKIL